MRIRRHLMAGMVLVLTAGAANADPYGNAITTYAGLRGSIVEASDTHAIASATDLRAKYNTGFGGSLYAGARLDYGFRVEGELLYHHFSLDTLSIAGALQANRTGYTQIVAPMANVFWDLPIPNFPVRPFIGAGVGGAYVDSHLRAGAAEIIGADNWHFAYQLMAGAAVPLSQDSRLTGMYRYFSVQGANFHCTPPLLPTTACNANTTNQSIDLGLEFDL